MKHKHFKISDNTLFVYKSQKTLKGDANTTGTDPTTTVMTMTVSGVVNPGPPK